MPAHQLVYYWPGSTGFSRWPLNADRSLDIVFIPDDGIADLSGTLTLVAPSGAEDTTNLVRHPRMRSVWGLDVIALPEEGPWSMVFRVNGPRGEGVGRLAPLTLGARPGPPEVLSWAIGLLPLLALLLLIVIAWVRVRPGKRAETWSWS